MRKLLLTLLCLFPALATAQTAPSPNLAGIAHVALRVHDLQASIAFYEKLGFVKAFELSRDGKVYEAFIKINDRQFIELYPTDAKNPQVGFLHLCFEGADLQSVHDFYVSKSLSPSAVKTAGAGNLLFTMPGPLTPQGPQNMEYTQYMPGSLHSKDFGQHLGKDRIATEIESVTFAANDPEMAKIFYTEQVGFKPAPSGGAYLRLPRSTQRIFIAGVESLGFRSYMVLHTGNAIAETGKRLRKAGFVNLGDGPFRLIDPDGNSMDISTTAHATPSPRP